MALDNLFTRCHVKGPNLVFILIDDVGFADFGYNNRLLNNFGSPEAAKGSIPTPNIDKLAGRGLKLTSHYVHPTCTPSRYINEYFDLTNIRYLYKNHTQDNFISV